MTELSKLKLGDIIRLENNTQRMICEIVRYRSGQRPEYRTLDVERSSERHAIVYGKLRKLPADADFEIGEDFVTAFPDAESAYSNAIGFDGTAFKVTGHRLGGRRRVKVVETSPDMKITADRGAPQVRMRFAGAVFYDLNECDLELKSAERHARILGNGFAPGRQLTRLPGPATNSKFAGFVYAGTNEPYQGSRLVPTRSEKAPQREPETLHIFGKPPC